MAGGEACRENVCIGLYCIVFHGFYTRYCDKIAIARKTRLLVRLIKQTFNLLILNANLVSPDV